ncbi:hypothetical protein OIDMADRAFT_62108 [Oidiodendron maius Zn]|uniref:Uncharacterized protein n=1 Tax=Oidiodendron maius (strain Zn) TaxID=913774 RepID=A0A0C3C1Z3_OIDMZ|nr:hypothetical protein OIDMADRAFT_62108 [Oidiodendron maius Zn]
MEKETEKVLIVNTRRFGERVAVDKTGSLEGQDRIRDTSQIRKAKHENLTSNSDSDAPVATSQTRGGLSASEVASTDLVDAGRVTLPGDILPPANELSSPTDSQHLPQSLVSSTQHLVASNSPMPPEPQSSPKIASLSLN